MKTTTRSYRGFQIISFNLRLLGDPAVRGMAYSVYDGEHNLSARENLSRLNEAKSFVDDLLARGYRVLVPATR